MGSRHVATNTREDNVSGFAGIPANMTGMAEKMKHGGYRTHLVGVGCQHGIGGIYIGTADTQRV